jgi:phosphatidylinositol-3,4,5-trisphosphate 3-phosphatase/dual-specificity protein phosphatase PTEN
MLLVGLTWEQAGKGRTGLMVCAYLVYTGMSAEDALQLYANRRTYNNQGVCD